MHTPRAIPNTYKILSIFIPNKIQKYYNKIAKGLPLAPILPNDNLKELVKDLRKRLIVLQPELTQEQQEVQSPESCEDDVP